MKKKFERNRIFTLNNPYAPRICPDLACEIGLNESLLLLQVEYWMATEGEERDGHVWVRRTGREIRAVFKFWGVATIERAIQSLCKKGLFVIGDHDEGAGRGGRWIRFDFDRLSKLKSVRVDCSTLEHPMLHSDRETHQNGASVLIEEKNKNIKKGYRDPILPPPDPEVLPPYKGAEFMAALANFETHRSELRKPLKPTSRKALYDKLSVWDESAATHALNEAVANGWLGVFAPHGQNGNGKPKVAPGKLSPDIRITTPEELEKMLGPSIKPK